MMMNFFEKKRVLDVLNSLEVIETNGGDAPYILVENSKENRKLLNEVGITNEVIDKYGDEEMFCVLALAFTEGLADYYESGKLFYRGLTKEGLINDIQVILDSPLTDFDELHEAIQDVLNKA